MLHSLRSTVQIRLLLILNHLLLLQVLTIQATQVPLPHLNKKRERTTVSAPFRLQRPQEISTLARQFLPQASRKTLASSYMPSL